MLYIKRNNGNPKFTTLQMELRKFPKMEYSPNMTKEQFEILDIAPFISGPKPDYDPIRQKLERGEIKPYGNIYWVDYVVVDLDENSITRNLEKLTSEMREKRNRLLSESDWTQVPDAPVDRDAWAVYRQELRDLTDQVGFPENIVWPVSP